MALMFLLFFSASAFITINSYVSASFQEPIEEPVQLEVDWPKLPKNPFNCTLEDETAECCGRLKIPMINFDKSSCLKLAYISETIALNVTFTIEDKNVFSYQISANNPPPICVGLPFAKLFSDICIEFYDLQVTRHHTQVCMKIRPRLFRKDLTEFETGCVNLTSTDWSTETYLTELY